MAFKVIGSKCLRGKIYSAEFTMGPCLCQRLRFYCNGGPAPDWDYDAISVKIGSFAGNGSENIVDGSLNQAQLAQPSGLSVFDKHLFVADSEASALRRIDLGHRITKSTVGKGLIALGFREGCLDEARVHHPRGVTTRDGNDIFVADTYNHSVRLVD